jgi:long-chain fatty acid transport protein
MMRLVVKCVISLLIIATSGFAQVSFNFTGGGARAKAMGGAFIGVANDIASTGWNPAGLYEIETPILGLGQGWLNPRGDFQSESFTFSPNGTFSSVTHLDFAAPMRIRGQQFVFAVSYHRMFEDYDGAKLQRPRSVDFNGELIDLLETVDYESHQSPNVLNLGFGTRVSESFSIGMTLDVYLGKGVTDVNISQYGDSIEFRPDDSTGAVAPTVWDLRVLDTAKYSGFGITLATKFTSEKLGVGLVARLPLSFNTTTDRKFFRVTSFAGNPQSDNSDTTYYDDILVKYDLPIMIGAGISYQATEKLLVAADVEYRPFSSGSAELRVSRTIRSGQSDIEVFESIPVDWEDVIMFRTGAEYMWETDTKFFPVVPLRLGFGYEPIPTPDRMLDGSTAGTNGIMLSAGFGIQWSQIHLDFSYAYGSIDRTVLAGSYGLEEIQPEITELQRSASGLEFPSLVEELQQKNKDHHVGVSFTGYF